MCACPRQAPEQAVEFRKLSLHLNLARIRDGRGLWGAGGEGVMSGG